ncbi:hypothetical protein M0805_008801 [Coniferiporia weirii]|nr:hypothetical protein M0805_008801 [Coniferiporia weirii]
MERAIGIPEVLDTIFSSPLVPAEESDEMLLVFERAVVPGDWQRFNQYAKRIREFTLTPHENYLRRLPRGLIGDSIFIETSITRPALCIFPQLEKLIIDDDFPASWFRYSILFLQKSVSFLSLTILTRDNMSKHARPLLNEILYHSPALTWFELSFGCSVKGIEDDLCLLLSGLTHLETLYLSPCMLTTPVLHSIALLPSLSQVGMLPHYYGCTFAEDVTHFKPPDFDNAFASLSDLAIQGRFVTITEFFLFKRFPLKLRTLSINIMQHDPFPDFRLCLEAIANSCSELKELEIVLSVDSHTTCRADPVTAHALSPLGYFTSLETFKLEFYEPIDMSDIELISIVKMCPSLRSLHLNSWPFSFARTSLTIQFLALLSNEPVAEKLEHLGIYLDASETANLAEVGRCMKNMRSVSFGASPACAINDSLLIYLSRLLPVTCKLDLDGPGHIPPGLSNSEAIEFQQRLLVWEEVKKTLPLLTLIRQDERELERGRV